MPQDGAPDTAGEPRRGRLKSPENLAAGLFLLALASIGFFGTLGISAGTLAQFGAGMLPRAVSVLVAACGIALLVLAFSKHGTTLHGWSLRGLFFVLGAVIAFGLTVRGFDFGLFKLRPLGLVVAGPLAVTLAALADPDTKPREIVIFAVGLTALCVVLFRFILRLPIPIAPWLLGY
jgi:hypothetical protein